MMVFVLHLFMKHSGVLRAPYGLVARPCSKVLRRHQKFVNMSHILLPLTLCLKMAFLSAIAYSNDYFFKCDYMLTIGPFSDLL